MAGNEIAEFSDSTSWWWNTKIGTLLSWKRTSWSVLANIEHKILSCLKLVPECRYVRVASGAQRIWTVTLNSAARASSATPLVMLHGMGSGIGLWVLNLDALAQDRPVYAIDLLGFGRSSRVPFSKDATECEQQFVDSIEDWRQSVGIEKMILLGHSFGGYLAASYAIQHASRVKHLVLVDPWGFPQLPHDVERRMSDVPLWLKIVRPIFASLNPFAGLRAFGPWGPSLVAKFKGDLVSKYNCLFDDMRMAEYMYHCNAQTPSGERAFKNLSHHYGWAKFPMINRISEIPNNISMTMIYGSRSWVDFNVGYEIKGIRKNAFVDVQVVRGSGHHIYAEKADVFNALVSRSCQMVDGGNTLQPIVDLNCDSAPPNEIHDKPQPLDIAADAEP